jgi:hypothetical protein
MEIHSHGNYSPGTFVDQNFKLDVMENRPSIFKADAQRGLVYAMHQQWLSSASTQGLPMQFTSDGVQPKTFW